MHLPMMLCLIYLVVSFAPIASAKSTTRPSTRPSSQPVSQPVKRALKWVSTPRHFVPVHSPKCQKSYLKKRFKTPYWYRHFCLYPKTKLYRWQRKGEPEMWFATGDDHVVLFDRNGHLVWTSYIGHSYVWLQSFLQVPHKYRTLALFRAHGGSKTTFYQIILIGIPRRGLPRTQRFWYRKTSPYPGRYESRFWLRDIDVDGIKDICLTKRDVSYATPNGPSPSTHRDVCFVWERAKRRWSVNKYKPIKITHPTKPKKLKNQPYLSWPGTKRSKKPLVHVQLPSPILLSKSFAYHSDLLGMNMRWKALKRTKHTNTNWMKLHNESPGILKCIDRATWLYGWNGHCQVSWKRGKNGRPSDIVISKDNSPDHVYRNCLRKALQQHKKLRTPASLRARWELRWKPYP